MIQRKQTLFLFIAVCALALCFMYPIATFTAQGQVGQKVTGQLNLIAKDNPDMINQIANCEDTEISQSITGIKTWPLLVLTLCVIAIALVSIFLYKKRVLQMRIVACGFLLCVINVFLIFIWAVDKWCDSATQAMACTDVNLHWGISTWAPIVAIVFLFLAQRAIKKDEEKVRAADRLR